VKRLLIGIALAGAVAAGLYAATLGTVAIECEACMRFDGRQHCAAAAAPTQEEAEQAAVATACAVLTSGVTPTLQCQASPPVSLGCR
jgi:hypothetical protein